MALGIITTPAVLVGIDGLLDYGFFGYAVAAIVMTRDWLVVEPLDYFVAPTKYSGHNATPIRA